MGSYPTEVQAAVAYDDAARKAFLATSTGSGGGGSGADGSAQNADGGGGGGASTPGRDGDGDVAATNASPTAASGSTPASPETTAEGAAAAAAAAVAAGAGAAAKPSGPEPSYNFGSDQEAQERLGAITMFEAGLEAPPPLSPAAAAAAAGGGLSASDTKPDVAAGLVEVDPSLVLVMGTKGKLRRMDREERSVNGESPVAAAAEGPEGGGGEEQRQSKSADSSAESPASAATATPASTETLAVAGTAIVREGNGSTLERGVDGGGGGRGKGSRDWKRLPLRGCGTDDGGAWEAAGRRASAVPMPDVRLLNRLVHYLATSSKALELKSEQHLKKASKVCCVVLCCVWSCLD